MKKVFVNFFSLTVIGLCFSLNSCGDPCEGVVCNNGGSCIDAACNCITPWTGVACDTNTDVCFDVNCGTNGTCNGTTGTCDCNPGWEGENCDIADLCFDVNCGANGTCHGTSGVCDCIAGWEGDSCNVQTSLGYVGPYYAAQTCDNPGTGTYIVTISTSVTQDDKINFSNFYGMVDFYGVSTSVYGLVDGDNVTIPNQSVTDGIDTWSFDGTGTRVNGLITIFFNVNRSGVDSQACTLTLTAQ